MSILLELNTLFGSLNIPVETGLFSEDPPYEYMVVTPLSESFSVYGDDRPLRDIQEVRISIFCKNNYLEFKNQLLHLLLAADFVITDRRYVGHEDDTGYHHYAIDVAKDYEWEE